jgi:hypothetical protein
MAEVRGGPMRPGSLPGQQPASLQDKEQAKVVQQQQRPPGKISAQDAARLAQQAGFQRGQKKPLRGLDLGDSSRSPIPVPDDELDTDAWSPERLESAQQHMALAGTQLDEAAAGAKELAEALAASAFLPTDDGMKRLQDLAERPAPEAVAMGEVTANVRSLFGIALADDAPLGHALIVAGLVVAGEAGAVELAGGTLVEARLAGGVQKVAERSNQAVGEAQKMSKGVSLEVNRQRTMVFKR